MLIGPTTKCLQSGSPNQMIGFSNQQLLNFQIRTFKSIPVVFKFYINLVTKKSNQDHFGTHVFSQFQEQESNVFFSFVCVFTTRVHIYLIVILLRKLDSKGIVLAVGGAKVTYLPESGNDL